MNFDAVFTEIEAEARAAGPDAVRDLQAKLLKYASVPVEAPDTRPYCVCGNEQTDNTLSDGTHVGPLCEPFLTGPLTLAAEAWHAIKREWGMCCGGVSADIAFGRTLADRIRKFGPATHLYLHPNEHGKSVYCMESPEDPCPKCREEGYDLSVDCGIWFYADRAQPYWVFDNDLVDTHGVDFGDPVPYTMSLEEFLSALAIQLDNAAYHAWLADYAQCAECGGHYYTPNGPCHENPDDGCDCGHAFAGHDPDLPGCDEFGLCAECNAEVTYHFNLPCTVSLMGLPQDDAELRRRLAASLRQQFDTLDDDVTGSLFTDIEAEPESL